MNDHSVISSTVKRVLLGGCAFAVMSFSASYAHAQVGNATQIADPARAGQDLFAGDELPELSPEIEVTGQNVQNAPAGAENITLQLNSIQIDGVSAYSSEQLDPVYRSYLGTTVNLSTVYDIANALTTKYRNDGYILTQVYIPPQTIDGGVVRFSVVEGFVDQIIIQGDLKKSEEAQIRKYAEGLKRKGLLDAKEMERYLLLINDLPGISARAVLGRSPNVTGASDLTLVVEKDKYDAKVSFDNHGSRFLGPYQGNYSGNLNSVFGFNERISTQFAMSGDKDNIDELLYGSIGVELPVSKYGTTVSFNASKTSTEPGASLRPFDVEGHSRLFSTKVEHPVIRSRTTNLFVRGIFDMRQVKSKNNLEPNPREDRIHSARLGATVQFMDTFLGLGLNAIDVEFSQGLDIFNSTKNSDTNTTRASGDPNYKKIEFSAQRLQRINQSVNILFAGAGQWSATPLLSSEEFGVGGIDIGRGYDSSEIVGEDGISGKVEVQWNEPKKIDMIKDYQIFAFFDAGRVWNHDSTTSAGKRDSLASTGLGIRADITDKIEAGVGVAFPLTRNRDVTDDRDPRYYFNISHKF